MRFAIATLLAAVLYTGAVEAANKDGNKNKDSNKKNNKKKSKMSGTTAICKYNLSKEAYKAKESLGKTMFWQKDAEVDGDDTEIGEEAEQKQNKVKFGAKWAFMTAEE